MAPFYIKLIYQTKLMQITFIMGPNVSDKKNLVPIEVYVSLDTAFHNTKI